jgi:hypothetical protein
MPPESKKPLVVCPRCGRLGRREVFRRYLPNGRVLEYVRVYHGKVKKVDPQTGRTYWSADVCHLGPLHLYGVTESWGKPGAGRGVPLPVRLLHITNLESIHFPTVIDRAVLLLSQVADLSKRYPEVLGRWVSQLEEIAENFDSVRDFAAMKAEEARLHLLLAREGEPRVEAEPLPIKLPAAREAGLKELTEDELRLLRIVKGLTALGVQDEFALKKKVQEVASLARRGLLPEPKREEAPPLEEAPALTEEEKKGEVEAAAEATAARAPSRKASGR